MAHRFFVIRYKHGMSPFVFNDRDHAQKYADMMWKDMNWFKKLSVKPYVVELKPVDMED